MRRPRRFLPALIACALLAACSGDAGFGTTAPPTTAPPTTAATTTTSPTSTTSSTTTTLPPETTTTSLPGGEQGPLPDALPAKAPFAAFTAVVALTGSTNAIPDHPTSLEGVYWDFNVPEGLRARLSADGFALDRSWAADVLHAVYSYWARYADGPVYVTTDAGYHEWHLVFSKILRDTEEQALLPLLEQLVGGLVEAARVQRADLARTSLATAADDVTQHFEAVATLLGLDVGEAGSRALEEVALAEAHAAAALSPTLGVEVDYTLLTPRGHYTRSEALSRYFYGMAMLGTTPFEVSDPEALRRAGLVCLLITGDAGLLDAWRRLYETTSFLVGTADDYTPQEVLAALQEVSPAAPSDPTVLADDAVVASVAEALRAARPVLIDADYASVRTMGARFVLDSFLLDQLVHPQVWERLEGSVLDVAAAMGSDWALAYQEAAGVPEQYPDYAARMTALRALVADRPVADWGGTVYDAWLYAILPMWQPHGTEFPGYMRTDAWAARAHQAGFGSYAELKHDTVLYTKQAFAEGDQPLPPATPRHWVEPDPIPFERLAEAARLLRDGLTERGLLSDETSDLLGNLIGVETVLGRLAREELAGLPISAADNDWLASIGTTFELLWLLTGEEPSDDTSLGGSAFAGDPDSKAPLVVDIMSNPSDALEIATGGFETIYVLVPNDEGQFQVAIGATYAFYEFWVPRGERLTDEEWRAMLTEGQAPERPAWLASLYD